MKNELIKEKKNTEIEKIQSENDELERNIIININEWKAEKLEQMVNERTSIKQTSFSVAKWK